MAGQVAPQRQHRLGRVEEDDLAARQLRHACGARRSGGARRSASNPGRSPATDAAAATCAGSTGSHGLPVVKPAFGASPVHGIGVRQPSRPLNSGQNVMPYGSCSSSNGTSASVSASSSPWYRHGVPLQRQLHRQHHLGQRRRRLRAAPARHHAHAVVVTDRPGGPAALDARFELLDLGADVRRRELRRQQVEAVRQVQLVAVGGVVGHHAERIVGARLRRSRSRRIR